MNLQTGEKAVIFHFMDKTFEQILASLPARAPRSRLDPYAEFIDELRNRGWPYREISKVLAEKCNVSTSPSNLHHFVFRRLRQHKAKSDCKETAGDLRQEDLVNIPQKIEVFRQCGEVSKSTERLFDFDAGQPLKLTNSG